MKYLIQKTLAAVLLGALYIPAQATVVYNVSSTGPTGSGCDATSGHGLWTNNQYSGSCANYFDVLGGSTFTINNNTADPAFWTAILDLKTSNGSTDANVYIEFTDFAETTSASVQYKQEQGAPYSASNDSSALAGLGNNDIDFFTGIDFRASFIEIVGGPTYTFQPGNDFVVPHAFQFGLGANAKVASEFGGSAWIQPVGIANHHWDLNLTFSTVPEPVSLLIMGLGLLGLGATRIKIS